MKNRPKGPLLELHTTAAYMGLYRLLGESGESEEVKDGDLGLLRYVDPEAPKDVMIIAPSSGLKTEVDKKYRIRDISKESLSESRDPYTYDLACDILEDAGLLPLGWDFVPTLEDVAEGDLYWAHGFGPWSEDPRRLGVTVTSDSYPVIRKFVSSPRDDKGTTLTEARRAESEKEEVKVSFPPLDVALAPIKAAIGADSETDVSSLKPTITYEVEENKGVKFEDLVKEAEKGPPDLAAPPARLSIYD